MSERLLHALNGASIFPAISCLVLLGLYLSRESRRRGLRSMDWFKLPPSMNLVLALFIFDVGFCLRIIATWIWFVAGERIAPVETLLAVTYVTVIIGLLCKVRALTQPDHGMIPWFSVALLTLLGGLVLMFVL